MADPIPVAAYRSNSPTGWTACDKDGLHWPVTEDAAAQIEAARLARIRPKNKTQ